MKDRVLVIPSFSSETCEGQNRLNLLEAQAARLNEILAELRREGWDQINMSILMRRARQKYPAAAACIEASDFLFTGRKVVPSEKAFFSWYEGTQEGQAVRAKAEQKGAGLFGKFAKIEI